MQQLMARNVHRTGLCPQQHRITFSSAVSEKCLAKIFDIMKKTVLNVAQKWP